MKIIWSLYEERGGEGEEINTSKPCRDRDFHFFFTSQLSRLAPKPRCEDFVAAVGGLCGEAVAEGRCGEAEILLEEDFSWEPESSSSDHNVNYWEVREISEELRSPWLVLRHHTFVQHSRQEFGICAFHSSQSLYPLQ